MEQSIKEQEKSADDNSFVCNGRFVCSQSHLLLFEQYLKFYFKIRHRLPKCIYVLFALNYSLLKVYG